MSKLERKLAAAERAAARKRQQERGRTRKLPPLAATITPAGRTTGQRFRAHEANLRDRDLREGVPHAPYRTVAGRVHYVPTLEQQGLSKRPGRNTPTAADLVNSIRPNLGGQV